MGFLQAAALTLYVVCFSFAVRGIGEWTSANKIFVGPIISPIIFLLAFIVSALVCGFIAFGYPVHLFLNNGRKNAWRVLFWNAIWLVAFLAAFLAAGLAFSPSALF